MPTSTRAKKKRKSEGKPGPKVTDGTAYTIESLTAYNFPRANEGAGVLIPKGVSHWAKLPDEVLAACERFAHPKLGYMTITRHEEPEPKTEEAS